MTTAADNVFHTVRHFINRHALLAGARGVVLAVSGGADSLALLDILHRLTPRLTKPPAVEIHVAHLNHLLRGSDADADAEFVRRAAQAAGVGVTVQARDVRRFANATGKGIEEAARHLRYDFLLEVARQRGFDRIATGHTMSDQAETFLLRLLRGASLRGLSAMRPLIPAHRFSLDDTCEAFDGADANVRADVVDDVFDDNQQPYASDQCRISSPLHPSLIRPLLCVTRAEIEDYCRQRDLPFRDDASNLSLDYTRNRIRHETLPTLRAINPRVVERLAQTAELLAGEEETLEAIAGRFLDEARARKDGWHEQQQATGRVRRYALTPLLEQPQGLLRRMLARAIGEARAACPSAAARRASINRAQIDAVERLARTGKSGDCVTLPQGLEVWRESQTLCFVCEATIADKQSTTRLQRQKGRTSQQQDFAPEAPIVMTDTYQHALTDSRAGVTAGGLLITLRREQAGSLLDEVRAQTRQQKLGSGIDWLMVALDDRALPADLIVRPRRPGETALIDGRQKRIKLKKLMIDHKIPSSRRMTHPLVATSDGEYVWSPGLPPAAPFAAREQSQRLAILRASFV